MLPKFKNIVALLLLLVFIFPTLVKLEHHHEPTECKATNEIHFDKLQDKCVVCNFEFSIFSDDIETIALSTEPVLSSYCNNYKSVNYSTHPNYSFSLRAPPYKQV